jgi:hypothetical protein
MKMPGSWRELKKPTFRDFPRGGAEAQREEIFHQEIRNSGMEMQASSLEPFYS